VCLLRSIVPKPSTRSNQIPAVDARPSRRWHSHPYARPFRLKRAAHTPPGCCSPPPRSFSTRRDETGREVLPVLCAASEPLPSSLSRFHLFRLYFFPSPPFTATFLPLEVRPRILAAISVGVGVPRSQKSAGQHCSPTVQEKRSKSKSFETEP
jgi:hypothetical protein